MTSPSTAISPSLAFYAAHGAALFPIPAGQKNPTGIVGSFKQDHSRDPAQWERWAAANPGCNFGVVAFASNWIIADADTSSELSPEDGRAAAWAEWCALCTSWGVEALAPHVQSARGGWHFYFKVPEGVDAATLRQPDAIKGRINIRCVGFTVAAGSYYDGAAKGEASGPYILLSAAPPHPAPAALLAHCTRANSRTAAATPPGSRDANDIAALVKWLADRHAFDSYEDWVGIGMALKLELGDAGLDTWELAHDGTPTADLIESKWASFATDPAPGSQTLNTWLDRAHKMGWRGSVRKSTAALFGGIGTVAAIAASAGAALPLPDSGIPMLAGQEELARVGGPILAEFMASTADCPTRPLTSDYPTLPEACAGHGLFGPLRETIDRVVAMAETPKGWKAGRVVDCLAVLSLVHKDVFDSVVRKLRVLGVTVPDSKIRLSAAALGDKIERAFVTQDAWLLDPKGYIEHDNSDNVAVFLGIIGAEIRWNAWLERAEIRGFSGEWPEWTYIDDAAVAKLRTRANRTKTRFRPSKEFFWESLLALARAATFDPVLDTLERLAGDWDGTPRLSIWLSRACGVPCDPYHQAVGRNIIGGMVRRARHAGCKHDTMPVLFGPQGTGKSTAAALLAINPEWFTDSVLLGDASKELVLSLAGKLVVEVSEMGMRGSVNPSHVKAMISRQTDSGRPAYARAVAERARRNIFIGTTNDDEPLSDPTGNRRFLPVRIAKEIDLAWLAATMPQLVGEAARLEAAGADFGLPREVWGDAATHQEAARSASDIETLLGEWFAPSDLAGPLTYIHAADLIHLGNVAGWRGGGATGTRGAIMRGMGFRSEKPTIGGKRTAIWVRGKQHIVADIPRLGTRYMVGQDAHGRPLVQIRAPDSAAPVPGIPSLPALPPMQAR